MPLEITDEDLAEKDNDEFTKARITFSRKLHYFRALINEDAAKLVVRQNLQVGVLRLGDFCPRSSLCQELHVMLVYFLKYLVLRLAIKTFKRTSTDGKT